MTLQSILLGTLLACTTMFASNVDESDPYGIRAVKFALKMRTEFGGINSGSAKQIPRLGDAAAVALIKVLSPEELTNPQTVRNFLPIIRLSFAYPLFIVRDDDKSPRVTLLLLSYVHQELADDEIRKLVVETEEFIKNSTAQ